MIICFLIWYVNVYATFSADAPDVRRVCVCVCVRDPNERVFTFLFRLRFSTLVVPCSKHCHLRQAKNVPLAAVPSSRPTGTTARLPAPLVPPSLPPGTIPGTLYDLPAPSCVVAPILERLSNTSHSGRYEGGILILCSVSRQCSFLAELPRTLS